MDERSPSNDYAKPYNTLKRLGIWNPSFDSPRKERLFFAYQCTVASCCIYCLVFILLHFYVSRHNIGQFFNKISVSILFVGVLVKTYILSRQSKRIDELRSMLLRDSLAQTDPDHVRIKGKFKRLYEGVRKFFSLITVTCYLTWIMTSLTSLKWEPRQMPSSLWIPINLNDNLFFFLSLFIHGVMGMYLMTSAVAGELCCFSNLVQMAAQYSILAENIRKLKQAYRVEKEEEFREKLRSCIVRHTALNESLKNLYGCYYWIYFFGLILACTLIMAAGMDLLLDKSVVTMKAFGIELGIMVFSDIFLSCYMGTLVMNEKEKVRAAVYDLEWTEMGRAAKSDVFMLIGGTSRNKPFGYWRNLTLEMSTVLWIYKTLANWLWLFYQLTDAKRGSHLRTDDALKKRLFICYRAVVNVYRGTNLSFAFIKLYSVLWDFKLISPNLTTTLFAFGIMVRNTHFMLQSDEIDKLRFNLYSNRIRQTEPEKTQLKEEYKVMYRTMWNLFTYMGIIFLNVWFASALLSLYWGPRKLPFSIWLPINLDNDWDFFIGFVFQMVIGIYVTIEGICGELNFFSLMVQIALQYELLQKDIAKIRSIWVMDEKINFNRPVLENTVQELLKNAVEDHIRIRGYIETMDRMCRRPLLWQLTSSLVLMVLNGIELLSLEPGEGLKLFYQLGFTGAIVFDAFVICFLMNVIEKNRQKLVEAVYDLPWYAMDCKIQRHVFLAISGMQRSKVLMAWKLFRLDFNTFLRFIRTVSSWLTLYWQLMR